MGYEFGLGLLRRSFMALVVAHDLRHEVSMCVMCLLVCLYVYTQRSVSICVLTCLSLRIYPMKRALFDTIVRYLHPVREPSVDVPCS